MECQICGNNLDNTIYKVKEMMFGIRDIFDYFKCARCGCLQIEKIPKDMGKYYPSNYYSFLHDPISMYRGFLSNRLRGFRDSYQILNKGVIGSVLSRLRPLDNSNIINYLSFIKLTHNSRILDVGCGTGALLYRLRLAGFKNIEGVDPYIKEDIHYKNGLNIYKRNLDEIKGDFDLIMFHHSLEHMPDQIEVMQNVNRLLKPNAYSLIRIPICSSYAWEHYGVNWLNLDAPRHFFLHSLDSFKIVYEKANLLLEKTIYDSNYAQFLGSEQYIKDISLFSEKSYHINPNDSIFSKEQFKIYQLKAEELNNAKKGDLASFFLRKP